MVPGTISALCLFPLATLIYAWTLQRQTNLAGPLVASFFMGASICAFFPGCMSYVSILKQHAAAAAGGALQAMMFISGERGGRVWGVQVSVGAGVGWWKRAATQQVHQRTTKRPTQSKR